MMGPLQVFHLAAILIAPQQVIFVSDIEGGQYSQARSIYGVGLLGYGAHLGIDILRQFADVFRVGAPQVVGLIKNFDANATVGGDFTMGCLLAVAMVPLLLS